METIQQEKIYLKPETLLRFLTEEDELLDTMILCNTSYLHIYTFDQSLYEALGSIEDKQTINFNKLTKLLEVIDVVSMRNELRKPRPILREERVKELQDKAKKPWEAKEQKEGVPVA